MIRYGKLINGQLEYAPLNKYQQGVWYIPCPPTLLVKEGYKIVVLTEKPNDGKEYQPAWEETVTAITQVWRSEEDNEWHE